MMGELVKSQNYRSWWSWLRLTWIAIISHDEDDDGDDDSDGDEIDGGDDVDDNDDDANDGDDDDDDNNGDVDDDDHLQASTAASPSLTWKLGFWSFFALTQAIEQSF